jgi:hypothetical protein
MRPLTSDRKDSLLKDVTSHQEALAPNARPQAAQVAPDLAEIVDAWPELPAAMKAGILAMVKAASAKVRS